MSKRLILGFLIAPSWGYADTLSWKDSVERARTQNADLRAAEEAYRSAIYREDATLSGFLPKVTGELRYGGDDQSDENQSSLGIKATQNLFSGLNDLAQRRSSAAQARKSLAALQIARAQVSYDLKGAFEGHLYSQEYAKLTGDILKRREENLSLVQLRFQSGRENKGSVLLSQAYLAQARYDDLQAQHGLLTSRSQLAKILGSDDPNSLAVVGEVPTSLPSSTSKNLPQLILKVPEYEQALAQESSAEADILAARSQFFPSLNLEGNYSRAGQEYFPEGDRHWNWSIGLSIPLFSGGKDYFATRAAAATWSQNVQVRVSVGRQLLEKLERAQAAFEEAVAKLAMDESFRLAAQVRSEIARKKYNNGLLSFEDWDLIENDLIDRQKTYLASKRNRVVAEAAWEQAQGKGVIAE